MKKSKPKKEKRAMKEASERVKVKSESEEAKAKAEASEQEQEQEQAEAEEAEEQAKAEELAKELASELEKLEELAKKRKEAKEAEKLASYHYESNGKAIKVNKACLDLLRESSEALGESIGEKDNYFSKTSSNSVIKAFYESIERALKLYEKQGKVKHAEELDK